MRQLIAELLWYLIITGSFYLIFNTLLNLLVRNKLKETTRLIVSVASAVIIVVAFVRVTVF